MAFRKLTSRFLIIVFGLLVVIAVLSSITLSLGVNGIVRKPARSFALERAQEVRARPGDMLEREAALARKMTDLPSLHAWMLDEHNVGLRTGALNRLDSFTRAFLDGNYFVVVGQSRTYYNKPADRSMKTTTLEPNRPADIWYIKTVAGKQDVSFNLDYNALVGAVRVWINCLVRDNGKVIGIAGTGIDMSELVSRLVSAQGVGAQSMLTDRNGAVSAHPDETFLEHKAKIWTKGKKITVFDLAGTQRDRTKLEDLMVQTRAGKTAVDVVNLQGHTNLTAITDSANRIAAGDYDPPLEFRRTDEIGILADAIHVAEKLRSRIASAPIEYRGTEIHATISLGVAEDRGNSPVDDVIRAADEALFAAKRGGKNRVAPVPDVPDSDS